MSSSIKLDKINIEKLEGDSNWISWKFDMDLQQTLHKLHDHFNGKATRPDTVEPDADGSNAKRIRLYEEKEALARYLIGSTVSRDVKRHILTCKTATEMWTKLHSVFEQKNERRLDLLYCELFTYKKDAKDGIATHVSKLQNIFSQLNLELKDEGCTLPTSLLLNRILNTLPDEYLEFKNAWESVPSKDRSVTVLMERLRLHEQRLVEVKTKEDSEVALFANKEKPGTSKKLSCSFCKKVGHTKKNCFKLKNNKKAGNKHDEQAFVANDDVTNQEFIIDSGASHHITSHREWFDTYELFDNPIPLNLGDGRKMFAIGSGDIKVQMLVNGQWKKGHLSNTWHVPVCKQNLFSSGSALQSGLTEIANANKRIFRNQEGEVRAVGVRKGTLYRLQMKVVLPDNYCMFINTNTDLQTWHERLCHQNLRHVEKFLKNRQIPVDTTNKSVCDGCMYGKMARLPFHSREIRAESPGQIVHADVCGPIPEASIGGSRYFVTFKDDFTKYRQVYFLKEKSDVKEVTKKYLQEAKTTGHTIKQLMTDGGTEFVNNEMKAVLSTHGVQHRVTMPYSPQQNGAAERENRILIEAARSMLHAKNIDKRLWAEAVHTAAYVLNRTAPTGVDDKSTPYGLWHSREADISHLKIFGTECFVHIPDQKRKKLDKKALKGRLVGYCGDKDGFRIWTEDNKITLSRNVKFLPEEVCINIFPNVVEASQESRSPESQADRPELVELPFNSSSDEVSCGSDEIGGATAVPGVGEVDPTGETDSFINLPSAEQAEQPSTSGSLARSDNSSATDDDANALNEQELRANCTRRYPLRDRKPTDFYNCHVALSSVDDSDVYSNFNDINDLPECWRSAVNDELNSLKENNTWSIVDLPKDVIPIDSKWVFKIKRNCDGNLVKYKARLVARGFNQKFGIDYFDTYAPVIRPSTVRMLFSLAVQFDWFIDHWDVVTAFLYGTLNEDVYMHLPKGVTASRSENNVPKVCKLNKSLYGLKQAAYSWNKELHKALLDIGFKQSVHEPCIYVLRKDKSYLTIGIYVDDIFVVGNDNNKKLEVFNRLKDRFKLKDLGPIEQALSLRIRREKDIIYVDQKNYITKVLTNFGMEDCKPVKTPMVLGTKLTKSDSVDSSIPYQSLIGSLMYIGINTRPDILHAVTVLSQFNNCYGSEHFTHAKRVLRYLKGTIDYCFKYEKSKLFSLRGFVDADWANSIDRKSYSGQIFKLGKNVISFQSKKQSCVSLSSTEAEYVALAEGAKEGIFLSNLLLEIYSDIQGGPVVLYNDNQPCHRIAVNKICSNRSKHIDVKYHFIREAVANKQIAIKYLPTENMVADIFTKPLSSVKLEYFLRQLSLGL